MSVFTITTFSTFAGLLLAGQKLATAPDPINRLKALADLASNGRALAAVLEDTGLTSLQQEMARQAEDHARHFTHPGRARDDALALFWQVAPEAFADPAVFTAGDLDPEAITERMVAAIRASPHTRDFAATVLAEPFFRSVTRTTLAVMLGRADYIATITPDLWREALRRHGVAIALLGRVDAKVDALPDAVVAKLAEAPPRVVTADHGAWAAGRDINVGVAPERLAALIAEATGPLVAAAHAAGVTDERILGLARRIAAHVEDRDQAFSELERAVGVAIEVQARGHAGSNAGDFVTAVLARTAELSAAGRDDEAAAEADRAFAEWEERQKLEAQKGIALLDAGLRADILRRDPVSAARRIALRVEIKTGDAAELFDALRREGHAWFERGRDKGLNFDLEIAIELLRIARTRARDTHQRCKALRDLAGALRTLGEREGNNARLEKAVATYRAALAEVIPELTPLEWGLIQMNLGVALWRLGERESGTARLEQAVNAYHAALEVLTRDLVPIDWAGTQMNLANALLRLSERESETERLVEAVHAYHSALEELTRERVPQEWARAQMNLGNALAMLGEQDTGTVMLGQAVAAYRSALDEWSRGQLPLDWATAQTNLGNALARLGERESGTTRLEEAVEAYRAALEEWSRDRAPLNWAMATGNQGLALRLLAEHTLDLGLARRARDQIAAAVGELRDGGHGPFADNLAEEVPAAEALVKRLAAR